MNSKKGNNLFRGIVIICFVCMFIAVCISLPEMLSSSEPTSSENIVPTEEEQQEETQATELSDTDQ